MRTRHRCFKQSNIDFRVDTKEASQQSSGAFVKPNAKHQDDQIQLPNGEAVATLSLLKENFCASGGLRSCRLGVEQRIRRSFLARQVGAPLLRLSVFAHERDREREEGFRTPPLTPVTIQTANAAGIDQCAQKIKNSSVPLFSVLMRLQRPVVTWLQSKASSGLSSIEDVFVISRRFLYVD